MEKGKTIKTVIIQSFDELVARKKLRDKFMQYTKEVATSNPPDYYITSWDAINPVLRKFDTIDVSQFSNLEQEHYTGVCDVIDLQMALYDEIPEQVFVQVSDGIEWYNSVLEKITPKKQDKKLKFEINKNQFISNFNFQIGNGNQFSRCAVVSCIESKYGLNQSGIIVLASDYNNKEVFVKDKNGIQPVQFVIYATNTPVVEDDAIYKEDGNYIIFPRITGKNNKVMEHSSKSFTRNFGVTYLSAEKMLDMWETLKITLP